VIFAKSLDFCDSTVGRMTNSVSKITLRLNHLTDALKVYLIFLGVGIMYDNFFMWLAKVGTLFTSLYYEILSHEMKYYRRFSIDQAKPVETQEIWDSKWVKTSGLQRYA
jgi:hypothetical protein